MPNNPYRSQHCEYSLHYHIVFVTKYRRAILGEKHLCFLNDVFASLAKEVFAELTEFNGETDHVHLLLCGSPNTPSIARLVNKFKATSSRRLRRQFADIAGRYDKPVVWSRSYFIGTCGGAPLSIIKEYIQNQRS